VAGNTPTSMFRDLAGLGYRWVSVMAAHMLDAHNLADVERVLDAASDAGLRRSIWTWAEGDPVTEARFHASIARSLEVDVIIPNAESPYEFDGAWKSLPYAHTLREQLPDTVVGVSVLGGAAIPPGEEFSPWQRGFDVKPWLEIDADFLPQAYWNMAREYKPSNSVHTWELTGVPRERIHPTYGLWAVPQTPTAAEYAADTPADIVGFSSYLFEQYPVLSEYQVLAERVRHA
jgi:hypothetical protein